jgi:hypothetical protein
VEAGVIPGPGLDGDIEAGVFEGGDVSGHEGNTFFPAEGLFTDTCNHRFPFPSTTQCGEYPPRITGNARGIIGEPGRGVET